MRRGAEEETARGESIPAPQTCKHAVRKGFKLIKGVCWVSCTRRDLPTRPWGRGEWCKWPGRRAEPGGEGGMKGGRRRNG